MLTLTRREGESIVIGDTIRVTVKSVRGRHARLMISAPSGVPIYREEVYRAIEEENRAAAAAASQAALPADVGKLAVRLQTEPKPKSKGSKKEGKS